MAGWKGIVGTSFSPDDFDGYCHSLQWSRGAPLSSCYTTRQHRLLLSDPKD